MQMIHDTPHVRKPTPPCQNRMQTGFPVFVFFFFRLYGCFLKWWYPPNTPKWSFLVGKPMVVGYPYFWKHPYRACRIYQKRFVCQEAPFLDPGHLRSPRPSSVSRGDSFHTIASVGSNSAVVHYQPEKGSCKSLTGQDILLIDAW